MNSTRDQKYIKDLMSDTFEKDSHVKIYEQQSSQASQIPLEHLF